MKWFGQEHRSSSRGLEGANKHLEEKSARLGTKLHTSENTNTRMVLERVDKNNQLKAHPNLVEP